MMDRMYLWLAQGQAQINPEELNIPRVDDPDQAVADLLSAVYLIAGIVCVVIIIIGGFMFVTSSGDASLIKKAREMILGAVIGLIVVILAFTITMWVLGRFTA